MRIDSVQNSPYFCKTAIKRCFVKNQESGKEYDATLYEMNPKDKEDAAEMQAASYKRSFFWLNRSFSRAGFQNNPNQKFYLLKTDENDNAVAGAETSVCYFSNAQNNKRSGINVVINELAVDESFKNPHLPVVAQIVEDSVDRGASSVFTAFRADECASLKQESFSVTKNENWVLPNKRFDTLLSIASKKAYVRPLDSEY